MTTTQAPYRHALRRFYHHRSRLGVLLLFCSLVVLLAACSKGVRGEAPFAQVTSWRIDGNDLQLELRLRNVNDEPLVLTALAMQVTLEGDTRLLELERGSNLDIPPGGFETLPLRAEASLDGVRLLESLSRGERSSLAFRLQGSLESPQEGTLNYAREGFIYTVPGRPGEFR